MKQLTPIGRLPRGTALLLTGLLAVHPHAQAQAQAQSRSAAVPDPTRPMAALLGDTADARTAKPVRNGAPTAASSVPAVVAPPRLQSVRLAANPSDSTALLDGRLVRVGERVGERTLVAIDRHGITLRGASGDQRLSLLVGISQTASRDAPPAADTLATGTLQDKKP